MTLIEAIKSNRCYRREGRPEWRRPAGYALRDSNHMWSERIEDLLADDWEVLEQTVAITKQQLSEAVAYTEVKYIEAKRGPYPNAATSYFTEILAAKLGLGEP